MPLYLPNDRDAETLRQMAAWWRRQVNNTQGRSYTPPELGAPGDIVALVPSGGIPARDGTTLGSAECTLYRSLDGELTVLTDQTQTVYNLAPAIIPADTYVAVIRDRFGVWLAQAGSEIDLLPVDLVTDVCFSTQKVKKTRFLLPKASAGDLVYCDHEPSDCCDDFGTGTGTVPDSSVDCSCNGNVLATPPATLYAVFCDSPSAPSRSCLHCLQIPLEYDPTSKAWYGFSGPAENDCGVVITLALYCHRPPGGSFEMSVNYLWLTYDNQSAVLDRDTSYTPDCDPFDYQYTLSPSDLGTGIITWPIDIRVSESASATCSDCDLGTGTTPDDPPGPQPTPCCETTTLPGTLYATVTGCASCSFTTLTLFYNSSTDKWETALAPICNGRSLQIEMFCEAGIGWTVRAICDGATDSTTMGVTATSCDPFLLECNFTAGFGLCCDVSYSVTITE